MNVTSLPPELPLEDETEDAGSERSLSFAHLNESVVVRDDLEIRWRVIMAHGVVFASYCMDDTHSHRFFCVQLHLEGLAQQEEIAEFFGHTRMTQHRWEKRYLAEGLEGLAPYRPSGRKPSVSGRMEAMVVKLHGKGLGMRRIASRLGLSIEVVRGVYQRRGLKAHKVAKQDVLPGFGDESEERETTLETAEEMPAESDGDAAGAGEDCGGVADVSPDREPWDGWFIPSYENAKRVPGAGFLLALPVLRRQGVLGVFTRVYGTLGFWAMYGLQSVVLVMVSLALWRIRRPENVKEHSPEDRGRVFGLERIPEVKTIRRKLAQLARMGRAREVMFELAKARLEEEDSRLGYLYVDGHVRVYSGKQQLAKGYSMQRHMPVKATTDVWVNDGGGDPLFLVTAEINQGLVEMLPRVMEDAREIVGPARKVTVVFDRGGYSAELFGWLIDAGYDLITYRKGRKEDIPEEEFEERVVEHDGKQTTYRLHDQAEVVIRNSRRRGRPQGAVPLRQVTALRTGGHQTTVLTTRRDLPPEEVLWRMFNRWRQENFFKYMKQEFAIDGLVEYGSQDVPGELDRPNPEHRGIVEEIAEVERQIRALQASRCELIGDHASMPVPAGWEQYLPGRRQAQDLMQEIRQLRERVKELKKQKKEIPERISAGDLQRLKTERQLVAQLFKIIAYNIETELVRIVAPFYKRSDDEGRKLIAAALASPADIQVSGRNLRITIASQSSPHRTQAIAALCASLNKHHTTAPGTNLRLVFSCTPNPPRHVT